MFFKKNSKIQITFALIGLNCRHLIDKLKYSENWIRSKCNDHEVICALGNSLFSLNQKIILLFLV